MHHVFKLQSLKIDGNYKFREEVHACIHIVMKTAIEETGSKYIQGRPNEKWEVEIAFGVCPDRVGSSEQP